MSAVILHHPIFDRLQADLQRMGLAGADTTNVLSLRDARVQREREASERRFAERHGFDPDPNLPGAA